MTTRQSGGLLKRRKKQTAEDAAFTPEKVQQRVKEYEAVKNKPAKTETKVTTPPTEKYDENDNMSFDQAFAKAKKAGDGTFKWKGGMYNTDTKKVPKGQSGIKTNKGLKEAVNSNPTRNSAKKLPPSNFKEKLPSAKPKQPINKKLRVIY